jgi:hypothetical protein
VPYTDVHLANVLPALTLSTSRSLQLSPNVATNSLSAKAQPGRACIDIEYQRRPKHYVGQESSPQAARDLRAQMPVEDARDFLCGQGIDVDAVAPQVDGKFFSGFIPATKPAGTSR